MADKISRQLLACFTRSVSFADALNNMWRKICLLGVLLFPLAFFGVNRTWMYPVIVHPDSWMYTGYFVHPDLLYDQYPQAYHGTRMIHILLGWLAYHWLPVAQAIFVHKAVLFYSGYLLFFGVLRHWFRNERAAAIGAALGMTHGVMLSSLSWNYVNGTCIVLLLGNLWAQARMRETRHLRLWQMAAGAFYVGAVWNYLILAIMAPVIFVLFVYGLPKRDLPHLVRGVLWAALGGVIVTVAQGVVSIALGGPFLFFVPQVLRGGQLLEESSSLFMPLTTWIDKAVWMPYFGLVILLALLGIWRGAGVGQAPGTPLPMSFWRRLGQPLPFACLIFLAAFALFAILQFGGLYWMMLQWIWQAAYLLPLAGLVVGGWLAWLMMRWPERQQWLAVIMGWGSVLFIYGWGGMDWQRQEWNPQWALVAIPLILLAGLAGLGLRGYVRIPAVFLFIFLLAGLNVYLANRIHLRPTLAKRYTAQNEALFATVALIENWDRQAEIRFWTNHERPNATFHNIFNFFFSWGRSCLGEFFPGIRGGTANAAQSLTKSRFNILGGSHIIVFDPTETETAAARAGMNTLGYDLAVLDEKDSPTGGGQPVIHMVLWEVVPLTKPHGWPVELTQPHLREGTKGSLSPAGLMLEYRGGNPHPLVQFDLPPNAADAAVCHLRLGPTPHNLTLVVRDREGHVVADANLNSGAISRDWWLPISPDAHASSVEIQSQKFNPGGTVLIESLEL